jgi:hypothetical protein
MEAAAASFATIFAIIAAPLPPSRPADLPISDSDRCPRIIAAMDAGSKNAKIPQTKLAIAFPLVGRPERALLPVRRPPDFDFRMLQLRD